MDMKEFGVWEPYSVKAQIYKTAIEVTNRDQDVVINYPSDVLI